VAIAYAVLSADLQETITAEDRTRIQQNVFLVCTTVSLQTERKREKSAASVGRSKAISLSASGGIAP